MEAADGEDDDEDSAPLGAGSGCVRAPWSEVRTSVCRTESGGMGAADGKDDDDEASAPLGASAGCVRAPWPELRTPPRLRSEL